MVGVLLAADTVMLLVAEVAGTGSRFALVGQTIFVVVVTDVENEVDVTSLIGTKLEQKAEAFKARRTASQTETSSRPSISCGTAEATEARTKEMRPK